MARLLPEHRPRREPAAVGVELEPAGPAPLQLRAQQVHEPLRVAQLGRGHAVEVAVAQDLARDHASGADRLALDLAALVVRVGGDWMPSVASSDIVARGPRRRPRRPGRARPLLAVDVGLGALEPGRRQRAAAAAPEPVEHAVVDLAVVAATDEHRGAGVAHLGLARRCRRRRAPAPGRSRSPPRGRRADPPPGAPARSPPTRRAAGGRRSASPVSARGGSATGCRRSRAGHGSALRLGRASARYWRGGLRRAPGGCPPRT